MADHSEANYELGKYKFNLILAIVINLVNINLIDLSILQIYIII